MMTVSRNWSVTRPKLPTSRNEPAGCLDCVGPDNRREFLRLLVRVLAPNGRGLVADDRNLLDEFRRRRKLHLGEATRPVDDSS